MVKWQKMSETWYETNYHGYTLAVYFYPSTNGKWEATSEGKPIGRFDSLIDAQRASVNYADR